MIKFTTHEILDAFEKKGFRIFSDGRINLFGIRKENGTVNAFDDWIGYIKKSGGHWVSEMLIGTTEPGLPFLRKVINPKGCAILVPGQHRNIFILGLHRNKYLAFVQRGGKVTVARDNNKDDVLDYNGEHDTGYFGINLHKAGKWAKLLMVGKSSAGCQVTFDRAEGYDNLIKEGEKSEKDYSKFFDYALFLENEIPRGTPNRFDFDGEDLQEFGMGEYTPEYPIKLDKKQF